MKIKRSFVFLLVVFVFVMCLSGCGRNEVRSENEALSTLLSVISDTEELIKDMDAITSKTISQKEYDNLDKRLSKISEDIESADMYSKIDSVSERYERAVSSYTKAEKKLNSLEKIIENGDKK